MSNPEVKDSMPTTVGGVFGYIFRHPFEMFVRRWNWKAALFSGLMRGSIYFITGIKQGWRAALSAMSVEFIFRVIVSGGFGSLVQAFHRATPNWLGSAVIMFLLPAITHLIEFVLHTIKGDYNSGFSAIIVSVCVSIISMIFNLFAMRRGTMLVNDEKQQTLWQDIKQFPAIIAEFVAYPFIWLWRKAKKA